MTANRPLNDAEFLSALEWYRAAGVDLAVTEEPVDRFAASRVAPRAKPGEQRVLPNAAASTAAVAPQAPASLLADPSEARALAASAQTLDELAALMAAYDG